MYVVSSNGRRGSAFRWLKELKCRLSGIVIVLRWVDDDDLLVVNWL